MIARTTCLALACAVAIGCNPNKADKGDGLLDRDGDGQRPIAAGGTDCDDSDPSVYLGAEELCGNRRDDDCDGEVDEDGVGSRQFYVDSDRDGFGAPNTMVVRCELADGLADNDDDCNDLDPGYNPNAPDDDCDGKDQNCDDVADDDAEQLPWFLDDDGDGYGVQTTPPVSSCEPEKSGYSRVDGDCNDVDPRIHPGAQERCNGVDDNCDGDIDGPVIGEGRACVAEDCLEVHTRQDVPRNDTFWVRDQRNGDEPIQVECASVAGAGDGWMHITLDSIREDGGGSFAKGGTRGGYGNWDKRGGELVPVLDPEYRCVSPMRWVRFEFSTPTQFDQVYGAFTLWADDMGRTELPWGGVDNVVRYWGGNPTINDACGNGAVLFGTEHSMVKSGDAWGSPWAAVDTSTCSRAAESRCRTWHSGGIKTVTGGDHLRWEVHGTKNNHNPAATLRDIDLYVR